MLKIFSLLFLGFGIFVLVQVVMPFAAFKFWEVTTLQGDLVLIDPRPNNQNVLGVSIENVDNFPVIVSTHARTSPASFQEFRLFIPKIGLDWAKVVVDTNDFENSLALLPGSPLPGEKGNVFISGHSSLTQLYKAGNYQAVFARLPELSRGDEIDVEALGERYRYFIEGMKIVDPKDISVVNPPDNSGRYLTLMTCVPPGFNTKRLIVLARLKE